MTEPANANRQQRVLEADKRLKDHARELFILLKFDEVAKRKMPGAPSAEVLENSNSWQWISSSHTKAGSAKYRINIYKRSAILRPRRADGIFASDVAACFSR
jgi:hypothetical protein